MSWYPVPTEKGNVKKDWLKTRDLNLSKIIYITTDSGNHCKPTILLAPLKVTRFSELLKESKGVICSAFRYPEHLVINLCANLYEMNAIWTCNGPVLSIPLGTSCSLLFNYGSLSKHQSIGWYDLQFLWLSLYDTLNQIGRNIEISRGRLTTKPLHTTAFIRLAISSAYLFCSRNLNPELKIQRQGCLSWLTVSLKSITACNVLPSLGKYSAAALHEMNWCAPSYSSEPICYALLPELKQNIGVSQPHPQQY